MVLNRKQKQEVKDAYEKGDKSLRQIAKDFNVSYYYVYSIVKKKYKRTKEQSRKYTENHLNKYKSDKMKQLEEENAQLKAEIERLNEMLKS